MQKKNLSCLIICILFSSCASTNEVVIAPSLNTRAPVIFAIPEFEDNRASAQGDTVNAKKEFTDAFETAFIRTGEELGFKIVERRVIQKVLKELKATYGGNYLEEGLKEIGKLTNADALITGEIKKFQPPLYKNKEKPNKVTSCTTIGFSIKATDIESGEILFKGNILKKSGRNPLSQGIDILSPCDVDLLNYSGTVANAIVSELIKQIKKSRGEKKSFFGF